ncbi:hypothetical protein [Enterobacter hormaechei]
MPSKISISTLMVHMKGRNAIRFYNRLPNIRKKLWGAGQTQWIASVS